MAGRGLAAETAAVEPAQVGALLGDDTRLVAWLSEHSASVLAARARVGQARASLAQTHLLPNPSLELSLADVTVGATNPPGLGFHDTAIWGLELSQTIELRKRGPRIRSAELRLSAGEESYLDALGDALGTARAALGRVAYLSSRRSALAESLSDSKQLVELMRSRFEHGDLAGNDLDRLIVEDAVLEAEVAQNDAEYRAALEACGAAVFAVCEPGGADLGAVESAAPAAVAPGWEGRLAERPDLRSLAFGEQSATQDAILARRRSLPDPSLSLGFTRDELVVSGDQPRTLFFQLAFPLPLFDRGQKDGARAELQAEELRHQAEAARTQARSATAGLIERETALERTLAELRARALPRSKAVLDSTVAAVTHGVLGMTDLLLARRTHTELVLRVMDLAFSAFTARNDLRQAAGIDAELVRKKEGGRWTP